MSGTVEIGVKWGKESYQVAVDLSGTGLDLKTQLFSLTGVPPDRIKLMGLKGGKTVADDAELAACGLEDLAAKKKKLMMMGSTAEIIRAPEKAITFVEDLPEERREAATMKNFSPGLTNLGNTCYMNSCVRACTPSREVRDALNAHLTSASAGGGTPPPRPRPGAAAPWRTRRAISSPAARATQAVTPFRFLALLRQLFPQFAQTGQGGVPTRSRTRRSAGRRWCRRCLGRCPRSTRCSPWSSRCDFGARRPGRRGRRPAGAEPVQHHRRGEPPRGGVQGGARGGARVTVRVRREGRRVQGRVQDHEASEASERAHDAHDLEAGDEPGRGGDAGGQAAKILRSVAFPLQLDLYPHCSDALKKTLDPARSDKIEKEEIEANARLRADPRAQLNAEVAAGTKEAADKALEAMKKKEEDKDADAAGSSGGGSGDAEMTTEADAAAEAKPPRTPRRRRTRRSATARDRRGFTSSSAS